MANSILRHPAARFEKEAAEYKARHPEPGLLFFAVLAHGDGLWHVHKEGCQDVTRTLRNDVVNGADIYHTDKDVNAVVKKVLDPEIREMGYTEEDVKVHPCCHVKEKRYKLLFDGKKLTNAVFTATLKEDDLFSLAGQRIAIIRYIRTEDTVGALDNAVRVLKAELNDSGKYKDVRFQFWCDGYTSTGGSPQEI